MRVHMLGERRRREAPDFRRGAAPEMFFWAAAVRRTLATSGGAQPLDIWADRTHGLGR